MRFKGKILALALAAGFAAFSANAAVLTFDNASDITSNFIVDSFPGDTGTQHQAGYAAAGGFPASDGNFVHFNSYDTANSLKFISGPVFLNGFTISSQYAGSGAGVADADNNGRDYVLELYDGSDTLISSQTLLVGPRGTWDFLSLNVADVQTIRILATWSAPNVFDGWWPNVDNITFDQNNVPEPGTRGLVLVALAGLAARRRKST